ncbi:MAG: hypothetical protein KKF10_01890, partial [Verrucomicrobia bacterium]|nr:hypothetical protein [Verrucomicrobiota bacterium]
RLGEKASFFATLHSCGKVDERMVSSEPDKKRIYIDYTTDTVYSVNTQYAGNTVGLKKLALRLTIRKADREGWLAEHMFLSGVHGKGGRKTYLAGAYIFRRMNITEGRWGYRATKKACWSHRYWAARKRSTASF